MQSPLIVILLGPPGCGKGTHAPFLSQYLHLPHISTGDLFRENIKNSTSIGVKAKSYIDAGKLVPDDVVLEMLFSRLKLPDCEMGAILDGVPRTLYQAEAITKKLAEAVQFKVIELKIDAKLLEERICGRIGCSKCGRPYHKTFNPPKQEGMCDVCHVALVQRPDDTKQVLEQRLSAYNDLTAPLIKYYTNMGVLEVVDAGKSLEDVRSHVLQKLL